MNETVETLNNKMEDMSSLFHVVTANPEMVMTAIKREDFQQVLEKADMVTPDGIGVVIGSKIIKSPIPQRVTGYDLIHALLKKRNEEKKKTRVYCLGASDEIIKLAVRNLRQMYSEVEIVGYHHGYFDENDEETLVKVISETTPDLLLVGLGSPRQEQFIYRHKHVLGARVAIGCGGSFDVLSGQVKRAPVFFQKVGLEWFYRLIQQPSRLKRQLILPLFLIKVFQSKKRKRK